MGFYRYFDFVENPEITLKNVRLYHEYGFINLMLDIKVKNIRGNYTLIFSDTASKKRKTLKFMNMCITGNGDKKFMDDKNMVSIVNQALEQFKAEEWENIRLEWLFYDLKFETKEDFKLFHMLDEKGVF